MPGVRVARHPTGEEYIGLGRRSAVALALELGTDHILYADPDHVMHWLRADPAELQAILAAQPEVGFLVVGRSERAFAAITAASGSVRLARIVSLQKETYIRTEIGG